MENSEIVLPHSVEVLISRICKDYNQPPLVNSTRQILADRGEEASVRLLEKIQRSTTIRSFDGYVMFMIRNELNGDGSPQKQSSPAQRNTSPFSSSLRTSWLMNSPGSSAPVVPVPTSSANAGGEGGISPQLVALGELEFRKAFLILSYIGQERLEEAISADEIRNLKNLGMIHFEKVAWESLGRRYAHPADRVNSLEWESGKTYEYHCHVSHNGSCKFKGPYLEKSRNHLQRVLGDDNVLSVKFEKITVGKNSDAEYEKIGKEGLLVGLRRYRFFVFKDEDKAKKKDQNTPSVKCFFVRFESNASIDGNKEYVLSGKTIQEARSLFMHVHTISSMAKYMARFALILSKTMKLEVDLTDLNFMVIKDELCQDKDGQHGILTDGTGYISEDLALRCPKNVYQGSFISGVNDKIEPIGALVGESSDVESSESHCRVPPLLLQIRFFYKGYAVKGTLLVNKTLPPRTIQVRPSMIKVEPDSNLANICTRDSLEVVTSSFQPKRTCLSRNLIFLLSYGGVPDDFFMDILENELEESQSGFSHKRTALNVAVNRGGMDDFSVAEMIYSGIPLDESYLQYRMSIMLNEDRKRLLKGKLPITDSFYLMGTVDPSGSLESNQVSIILENGQISGKVLVYRQPGLHFGDVHVLDATYVEQLDEYVGHAKFAIFFSCKGPRSLADEMAGGDFDGDLFFVSKNPQLLDYYKVSEPWIEKCSPEGPPIPGPNVFSDEELESELFDSFLRASFQRSNAMSIAADSWYAIMDRFLTVEDRSEKTLMKENLESLVDIYYEALDASKSGKKVNVPDELRAAVFPHHMERESSFKSTSILGKIYDTVKSYAEKEASKKEIRKLPSLDVDYPVECRNKWSALYEQYRKDMVHALNGTSKEDSDSAANEVYDKYKQELYGAAEFDDRRKPKTEVLNEALAIYNICYDHAIKTGSVGKCGFAWKVAGSALFAVHASWLGEKTRSCVPSVWKEICSRK